MPQEQFPFFYFEDILEKLAKNEPIEKEKFYYAISNAYRNSSMGNVEMYYKNFLTHIKKEHPTNIYLQQLEDEADKAKKDFPRWASQIARYRILSDIAQLNTEYESEDNIKKEIDFGLNNFKIINEFSQKDFKDIPTQAAFAEFYPDCEKPNHFVSMKKLLSSLAMHHEDEAKNRGNKNAKLFNTLNGSIETITSEGKKTDVCYKVMGTHCMARYDHMLPFIEQLMLYAKNSKFNDMEYASPAPDNSLYTLNYKDEPLSLVMLDPENENIPIWKHGVANTEEEFRHPIWEDIEKIHKSVFDMDPKEIEENPKEFYNQVVTMIWLMGNLTPTTRGTGRYVEQWLALVHHFHGLPIPVLKLGFQLDCIDITMNLSLYKKLFLHFMEPNSLMQTAQELVIKESKDSDISAFLPLINRMDSPASLLTTPTKQASSQVKSFTSFGRFFEKPEGDEEGPYKIDAFEQKQIKKP